jgi:imidazolonepropionase-like amidohydrolase
MAFSRGSLFRGALWGAACAQLALVLLAAPIRATPLQDPPAAGTPGGAGLALVAAKALVMPFEGQQVLDHAVVLVKDGLIESVGPRASTEIPSGYEVRDLGARWVMPGMIDLHSHIGGSFDINDMVYLLNPELRVQASVVPDNPELQRAIAGGVTTILYIPGSGTNSGGQGILMKTAPGTFEEIAVDVPGSLKVAQWGNPERWAVGVGKLVENYNLREMFKRGLAYARRWRAFEEGKGPKPEKDIQWEIFRQLATGEVEVSVHTQLYQVVLMTITMLKGEFGLNVFTDHSEIAGWATAPVAVKYGVPSIIGPRAVDTSRLGNWIGALPTFDRIQGLAAGWQEGGQKMIGFNTDAPVIPAEELFLQSAMAVRYGMKIDFVENVRGLTIVPAIVGGVADRLGSLERGKQADIVVLSGDPSDPRTSVDWVLVEGAVAYDALNGTRRF